MWKWVESVMGFSLKWGFDIVFGLNTVFALLNVTWLKLCLSKCLGISDAQYLLASLGITVLLLCVKYLNWKIKKNFKDISNQFDDTKCDEQARLIHGILSSFGVEKDATDLRKEYPTAYQARKELLSLVMRYLHQAPKKIILDHTDDSKPLESKYYVYTLAAAHRTNELTTMSFYLSAIISKIIRVNKYGEVTREGVCHLPVLIVPQDRNVLLAESVTNEICLYNNRIHIPILTYQPEPRNWRDYGSDENPYELFYRIFLGCDSLRDKLRRCAAYYPRCRKFVIHCILVDDNVVRAEAMVRMIKDGSKEKGDERKWDSRMKGGFDKVANQEEVKGELAKEIASSEKIIRFAPVKDCATLFVASDEALFTDTQDSLPKLFKDEGLCLWCYFALPEEIKEALWKVRIQSKKTKLSDGELQELLKRKGKKESSNSEDPLPKLVRKTWENGWIDVKAEKLNDLIQRFDFSDNQTRKGSGGSV